MKIVVSFFLILGLLAGCAAPVYETLGDVAHVGQSREPTRQILLALPQDAKLLTFSGDDRLYLCDGYTLTLQTLPAGDLAATMRQLSGRELDDLTLLYSTCGDHDRRDLSWTAMGDEGDMVCRAAVIDDGNFHYCLSVMAPAEDAGQLQDAFNTLFSTFCLEKKGAA